MRIFGPVLAGLIFCGLLSASSPGQQNQLAQSPQILTAKTVYFDNKTGSDPVGKNAVAQLKKWGKFQVVADRQQADLILLLSVDPYKGGNVITASGQTGTVGTNGQIEVDHTPNFNKLAPTRYAYLTVINAKTGDQLWTAEHVWGGLLTGFNSVGARLIKELENQTRK